MKTLSLALSFCGLVSYSVHAIEVLQPPEIQSSTIEITDPDRYVQTLGTVSFRIDLSAANDDLLALKVRRSDLRLKDGRTFRAFGVHKGTGTIVLAGGDVTHLGIAAKLKGNGTAYAYVLSVLFYGADNNVITPSPSDVAVFDKHFKPLSFDYTPVKAPSGYKIPVTLALDTSGSMAGHISNVISATKNFMGALPKSAYCRVYSFSDDVIALTSKSKSCKASISALNAPLKAGGGTALYRAIETGFASGNSDEFPNITIVVTDGVNTSNLGPTLSALKDLKTKTNSRLFVFWAGNYQKGTLKDLADLEFVSSSDVKAELDRFFHSLGVSISGLQRIIVHL